MACITKTIEILLMSIIRIRSLRKVRRRLSRLHLIDRFRRPIIALRSCVNADTSSVCYNRIQSI